MTRELALRSFDIPSLHRFAVGFDSVFDELQRVNASLSSQPNYPPYNIVKHDEDHFAIELAVAGFRQDEVTITVEKNILLIKGEQTTDLDSAEVNYLHKGISARNFNRSFTLAEYVEVNSADIENGILTIELERKVPEEQKPRTIAITHRK